MTPDQAVIIKKSFDAMWPFHHNIADLCYRRLFEIDPGARALFRDDMERQRLKLMDMIAALVGALDQQELFQSLIEHSGRLHAGFGVLPSQYAAFGEALIWALERQLGTAFSPELKEAWRALYGTVQAQMLRGADNRH
jgi:hemoglobin-like flavoprotein